MVLYEIWIEERRYSVTSKGYFLKEISQELKISKSTASLWLRDVSLDKAALNRLKTIVRAGQLKAAENKKLQTQKILQFFSDDAKAFVDNITVDHDMGKVLCAVIYWCEGGKYDGFVQFTNSDPNLIAAFLNLLRKSFGVDEKKLRVCMHLHDYHDENRQRAFWVNITSIPAQQFMKSYRKPNTGKRSRKNYQGCIMIKYYDANVVRELLAI